MPLPVSADAVDDWMSVIGRRMLYFAKSSRSASEARQVLVGLKASS